MNKYSIQPLKLLLADRSRDYVKIGDIEQIEAKIKRLKAKKLVNQPNKTATEEAYLNALEALKSYFQNNKKLPKKELIMKIDSYIKKNKLYYIKKEHKIANDNTFYNAGAADSFCDVAFYNEAAVKNQRHHHQYNAMESIFYARFEERDNEVLIGNLQIDDRGDTHQWKTPGLRDVMLKKKNLYRTMVQESIKHALSLGKSKIIFQSGRSMEVSQYKDGGEMSEKIKITKENFDTYTQRYQAALQQFEKVKLGDITPFFHSEHGYGLVIEKHPEYYKFHHAPGHDDGLPLMHCLSVRMFYGKASDKENSNYLKVSGHWEDAVNWYKLGNCSSALKSINKIFKVVDNNFKDDKYKEKLEYLRSSVKDYNKKIKLPEWHESDERDIDLAEMLLDKFLIKYNYQKFLLKKYPEMKPVRLTPKTTKAYGMSHLRFLDESTEEKYITTFKKAQIQRPVMGKEHVVKKGCTEQVYVKYHSESLALFSWYEKILPEILNKLGLKCKKITLETTRKEKNIKSEAWEIVAGLDKFKTSPMINFATGTEFKKDTVSLEKLKTAASKFGIAPSQLKIVNAWVIKNNKKYLGSYDSKQQSVKLSTASLSLLAHEGFHQLIGLGLVPKKEYSALIAAGKELVRKNPKLALERLPKLQYNDKKTKNDEYAALFVEKYYEKESDARKYLSGAKLPVFKQLIGYIKEVKNILAGAVGHSPALAKSFLRRVEKGQIVNLSVKSEINKGEKIKFYEVGRAYG